MCEREREEEREAKERASGEGAGVYGPSLVTGPTGSPIVLCSHHLEVRTKGNERGGDLKRRPGIWVS